MSRGFKILTRTCKPRWYVCVTFRGEKYREGAGDTKKEALKHLRELETRLENKGTVTEKKVPFDFTGGEMLYRHISPSQSREPHY